MITRKLLSSYTDSYTKLQQSLATIPENDIIANNFELSAIYREDLDNVGCSDAYGAYVSIVIPMMEPLQKGGNKNLSSLVATKKTVIRNGKQMTTTIYVDPNDEEEKDKNSTNKSGKSNPHHVMASELKFSDSDSSSEEVKTAYKKLPGKVGQIVLDNSKCLTFSDGSEIKGLVYYRDSKADIRIIAVSSDSKTFNVFTRGFLILVGKAKKSGKSLSLSKEFVNSVLVSKYNMEVSNGIASLSNKAINELF